MLDFHEWWVSEIGHPPADEEDRKLFTFALRAWRSALTHGQSVVGPEAVERALVRVGKGETTSDDELTLRERIQIGEETIMAMEAELQQYEGVEAQQPSEGVPQSALEGPVPTGATPLGGTRWRCPRCNFMGGNTRVEHTCRGCSWPADDTRPWIVDPEGDRKAREGDAGEAADA